MTPEQEKTVRALMGLAASDNPDQGRPKVTYGFLRELLAIIGPLTERAVQAEEHLARVEAEMKDVSAQARENKTMLEYMRDRMNARDT